MARKNMKLERLRRRVVSAEAKMAEAQGTERFAHRASIFLQRSRLLLRAEAHGERNAEVNAARA